MEFMVWVVRKCGLGREIMVLGQTLVAGNVVQGEKLRVWVKPRLARVWSEERNYGLGSSADGGKCGPGSQTVPLGQARPSVVRGEKLWSWVKHWWREVWSREPNCGFGSSPSPPECGPRREIMVFGQTLVAGSVVQGAKPCPRVTPRPARVWSRERNCGFGSSPSPPECGLGSKTVPPGQARPRRSMVQGAKPCTGSSQTPPKCGPGSQTAARVKPDPARAWSSHLKYKKESKTNI